MTYLLDSVLNGQYSKYHLGIQHTSGYINVVNRDQTALQVKKTFLICFMVRTTS